MNLAMYILVNNDIKISKGKLAGQVGHAVGTYYYRGKYDSQFMNDYMKAQKKIILKCSQEVLENIEKQNYHNYIVIRDLGLTHLEPNTLTCINLGILDSESEDFPDFVKELKLY